MPINRENLEVAYWSLHSNDHPVWSGEISPAGGEISSLKEVLYRMFGPEVIEMTLTQMMETLNESELLI